MRIADGDGYELDLLSADVDPFRWIDLDTADVEDDLLVAKLGLDFAPADPNGDVVLPTPPREPSRDDAGAVPRQFSRRAVGIPDPHVRTRAVHGRDLEQAVGTDAVVVIAELADGARRQRRRQLTRLDQ